MAELVQENWILLVIALVIGLLTAWWVLVASRRTKVEITKSDDATPAKRNQSLIDAAPAATAPPTETPAPALVTPSGSEEVIAAAPPVVEPAAVPASAKDDLTRIKGLGPKLAEQLKALGITRFAQIAAWDDAEIDRIDAQLGRFQGRIRRDDWPTQARFLAAGDAAGYEAKFGKL